MVSLKRGSTVLMAVSLDMTLAGPTPWHVRGKATFKILFFKVSIHFDHPLRPRGTRGPAAAGRCARRCWRRRWAIGATGAARCRARAHSIVSLRETQTAPAALRVHPLAELSVRQRVVPLNLQVTKFGNVPLAAPTTFTVKTSAPSPTSSAPPSAPLQDAFALAQYQEMTDDEKLVRPAFERMRCRPGSGAVRRGVSVRGAAGYRDCV